MISTDLTSVEKQSLDKYRLLITSPHSIMVCNNNATDTTFTIHCRVKDTKYLIVLSRESLDDHTGLEFCTFVISELHTVTDDVGPSCQLYKAQRVNGMIPFFKPGILELAELLSDINALKSEIAKITP
jgi:hypothetical protein